MQKCKVCSHAEVATINKALVDGGSIRDIARRFGLSKDTVYRHKKNCLPSTLVKAREVEQVANADELLKQIQDLQKKTLMILDKNTGKDDRVALTAIREARSNLDLIGRLLGELDTSPKVGILIANPEWVAVRTVIIDALQPFTDAKQAVINALQNNGV